MCRKADASMFPPSRSADADDRLLAARGLRGDASAGDFAALAAGRPTVLRLQARVTVSDDHSSVMIENFPPNANPDETAQSIADRARARDWAPTDPPR
jgi:hypothetical protein